MTYYILPKNNTIFNINAITSAQPAEYHSHSFCLLYKQINPCYNEIIENLKKSEKSENTKSSVSEIFNDILEIISSTNILDLIAISNILHIGENNTIVVDCIRVLKGIFSGNTTCYYNSFQNELIYNELNEIRYDFMCLEMDSIRLHLEDDLNVYIINLLQILMVILKYQTNGGSCIIKVYDTVYKPITEFVHMLCSIYNRVFIIKPKSSNSLTFVKYIVCKNFFLNSENKVLYKEQYFKIAEFISNYSNQKLNKNITSIINEEIPYYFTNKMDDINIILGQQQLECMNNIINSEKGNNPKQTKRNNTTKNNFNKFLDIKKNIFLMPKTNV